MTALQEFIQAITENGLISINQNLIYVYLKKEKQQSILFAVWVSINCERSNSKDGCYVYKDICHTTDEVYKQFIKQQE